jgi:hypothetical protein
MAPVDATTTLQALLERQSELMPALASPLLGQFSIADVVTIGDSAQALARTSSPPFAVEVTPTRTVIRSKSAAAARLLECLPTCVELIRTHRGDLRYRPIASTFFEQFEHRLPSAEAPYGPTALGNVHVLCDCLNGAVAAMRDTIKKSAFVLRVHRHKELYDRKRATEALLTSRQPVNCS